MSDFRHAELGRIIRDLEAELSGGHPDWKLVLLKADDLISLALAALKDTTGDEEKSEGPR